MSRIVGFYVTNAGVSDVGRARALNLLRRISNRAGYEIHEISLGSIDVYLSGKGVQSVVVENMQGGVDFTLSSVNLRQGRESWDRYLSVSIGKDGIQIENDYAGSVPVFYSLGKRIVLSNLMSCVEADLQVSFNSLSRENIYCFLRYSHFLWDETAFKEINQLTPDSKMEFLFSGGDPIIRSIGSLRADSSLSGASDKRVAQELYELNENLVRRSLAHKNQVILPLSAGYDSRMIFSVLSSRADTRERLKCFTYGQTGCTEVEAARALCKDSSVDWRRVSMPMQFLGREYLDEIFDLFGSSLHMHGMYQLEFFNMLEKNVSNLSGSVLTSGFMSGVPAGQHNRMLGISSSEVSLVGAMGAFSQSRLWPKEELKDLPFFCGMEFEDVAEGRFRSAFYAAPGEIFHKSIVLDLWTRQRNFVSYYPRTFEWRLPVCSPHMTSEYVNFFLSLRKEHLDDRRAVELMFMSHYPRQASVVSNSNGLGSLTDPRVKSKYRLAKKLRRFGLSRLLPRMYRGYGLCLDMPALSNAGLDGFFPLFERSPSLDQFAEAFGGRRLWELIALRALKGDSRSYEKLTSLQSLAFSLLRNYNG